MASWKRRQKKPEKPELPVTPDGGDQAAAAEHSGPRDPSTLLRLGREALEVYEYEDAQRYLEQAFDLSGGEARAAGLLLELLVDYLAADEEALALHLRLSRKASRSRNVRTLLGIAAARSGEQELCEELLEDLEGERVAQAWTMLGEGLLGGGDAAGAERCLERASAWQPRPPAHWRRPASRPACCRPSNPRRPPARSTSLPEGCTWKGTASYDTTSWCRQRGSGTSM